MFRAFASVGVDIPYCSILTLFQTSTGESIPLQRMRAFTTFSFPIEDLASSAGDTSLSIPVEGGRAFTLVAYGVEVLAFRTLNYTGCSIPEPTFSTAQTHIFWSQKGIGRADTHTCSIETNWVPRTIRAFRANEEDILVGEVLHQCFVASHVESELEPCPFGFEEDILHVVVNDESSYAISSCIVSRDGCRWS